MHQPFQWVLEQDTESVSTIAIKLHNTLRDTYVCSFLSGDSTPAPSTYTLPSMMGSHVPHRHSSASYSMSGRPKIGGFAEDKAKAPAPNNYQVIDPSTYQKKPPTYTMRNRVYMPGGTYVQAMCIYFICIHTVCIDV